MVTFSKTPLKVAWEDDRRKEEDDLNKFKPLGQWDEAKWNVFIGLTICGTMHACWLASTMIHNMSAFVYGKEYIITLHEVYTTAS